MSDLLVAPCSGEAAKFAVMHWHYSRRMPVGKANAFGVWEGGEFVGAVLFGRGAALNLGRRFGLDATQCCELTRVALRAHEAPVTRIVALALAALHEKNPGLRVVVSFADPKQGHLGTIYQAGNWIYLGETSQKKAWRHKATGRTLHTRVVSNHGYVKQFGRMTKAVARSDECEPLHLPAKLRYVMPLDRAMRRQIAPQALPYPRTLPTA